MIDFTTPRTALDSLKEAFVESRIGRPIQRKRDRKAYQQIEMDAAKGELPEGMRRALYAYEHFNEIPELF